MNNNYLTRKVFFWIMGTLIMVGISVATYMVGRIDSTTDEMAEVTKSFNHNFTSVKEDISSMKTDISWLKNNLTK